MTLTSFVATCEILEHSLGTESKGRPTKILPRHAKNDMVFPRSFQPTGVTRIPSLCLTAMENHAVVSLLKSTTRTLLVFLAYLHCLSSLFPIIHTGAFLNYFQFLQHSTIYTKLLLFLFPLLEHSSFLLFLTFRLDYILICYASINTLYILYYNLLYLLANIFPWWTTNS